ncbi:MAG TPA: FxsA family protein [bacterium]|nr:FxsA family protein [bacterium]
MLSIKLLLRFFDKTFVTRLLMLALLYSLVPLAEIFLLIYLGDLLGTYLILALTASTGLIGLLIALNSFQRNLKILKQKIKDGQYPGEEFVTLTGVIAGGLLLLTPGFITDFLGFLLFVPAVRNGLGRLFIQKTQTSMKELYEYLKLYDY